MKISIGESILELVEGDITRQETEAIVNAANSGLRGGGGVDGAIHRAGGPSILEECRKIGGCPTGQARMTGGGNLKSRYVIHAVGPVYRDGNHREADLLSDAYENSLELALRHGIKTISFPSISTGAYGYPLEAAARVALGTVVRYLLKHPEIQVVRFVLFGKEALRIYSKVLELLRNESWPAS
jgi:O-acetyl-ADP-ribose deacetylase